MALRELRVYRGRKWIPPVGKLVVHLSDSVGESRRSLTCRAEPVPCFSGLHYVQVAWMRNFSSRLALSSHGLALDTDWQFNIDTGTLNVIRIATDEDIRAFIKLRKTEPEPGIPNLTVYEWLIAIDYSPNLIKAEKDRLHRLAQMHFVTM